MFSTLTFVGLYIFTLTAVVNAQQPTWAQCGGNGWTGGTTCVSGTVCTFLNDWYSQCIPGTAAPSSSSSAPSTTPTSTPVGADKANYWFSFGDSYTQTQFSPSGILPSIGNALGNPPYPGFTAVGGTNWIDVDTVVFNKSLIFTYNYAYGGATIDASLVTPYEPTVLSMTDQVNQFLTTVANKPASTPWTSSNALFSFFIGINDIGNSYYQSGSRDANVGARNFLFINVPPIDRSPLCHVTNRCWHKMHQPGHLKIRHRRVQLETRIKPFGTVLDNPTKYGFVDATSYGGTGDFWGNNYHPSSAFHTILGQQIAGILNGTVW
ncbi:hypothetical protein NLI96_g7024 [Meripilus lineatus]|uniref:CBM1 domain-containing protein n=1 Tax=Meripilus lineatus TaxID=2056292 RepID=A0AAD5V1N7_9APHY|nr:hypothetical protein NLI96_g7024 [Physisporinus lineatus]